jgi:hypothetical protein
MGQLGTKVGIELSEETLYFSLIPGNRGISGLGWGES